MLPLTQGEVKLLTGGTVHERNGLNSVVGSRIGAIPIPTVTVRKKELLLSLVSVILLRRILP